MRFISRRIFAAIFLISLFSTGHAQYQTRIVGGSESDPNARPYFTALMDRDVEVTVRNVTYAGSLMVGAAGKVSESVLIDCGLAQSECVGVNGLICLIERGTNTFREKALNCQNGGGIGAIVYNNVSGSFLGNLTSDTETSEITIPVVAVSSQVGARIINDTGSVAETGLPDASYCGAAYIGNGWVLTAGHCVLDLIEESELNDSNPADKVIVNVGGHDLRLDHDNVIGVEEIMLHPDYQVRDDVPTNDFALLRLSEEPVNVEPVVAATGAIVSDAIINGDYGVAIGRGVQDPVPVNGEADSTETVYEVYEVAMPFIPNSVCETAYPGFINSSMLCAGTGGPGVGTCFGDSGGPIIINREGKDYIAGVTSWGSGCAQSGFYDVYASVPSYLNGIYEVLNLPPTTDTKVDDPVVEDDENGGGGSAGVFSLLGLLLLSLFNIRRVRSRQPEFS